MGARPLNETEWVRCITATDDVYAEIAQSVSKHGSHAQSNLEAGDPNLMYNLAEEFGEVAHALTYDADPTELRKELIQVAAMAVAWVMVLDRE